MVPMSHEVAADLADAVHRRAVDQRLRAAIDGGPRSFGEVLLACEGADPRLVAQRVRALGLPVHGMTVEAEPEPPDPWTPELHARDFEWYFTPQCAAELAARVGGPGRRVLCLGTPTVAFALLPSTERVTLVDRNPLALARGRDAGSLHAITEDLAAARLEAGAYDAVVFDAPWYPAALRHWLAVAAAAVRPGGTIAFALLPALHRPSAAADRAELLARARALGEVAVAPGWLRYGTPRFEREALWAAGLPAPAAWRRADLVELTARRPALDPAPPPPPRDPPWTRVVVGSQVIHLDPRANTTEPGEILTPVGDAADFRYASISTRDPRRSEIGLWTSRSRVARVRRPDIVAALLERLAATGEHRGLQAAPELRPLTATARAGLLGALRRIVALP